MIEKLRNHPRLASSVAGTALVGTLATGSVHRAPEAPSRHTAVVLSSNDLHIIRLLRIDIINQQQSEAARNAHRIAAAIPTPYSGPSSPSVAPSPTSLPAAPKTIPAPSPTEVRLQSASAGQFWFGDAVSTAKVKASGKFANAELAYNMAKSETWFSIGQMACLDNLWAHESGFDEAAHNPTSRAGGIPQANPESKIASAGADWDTNPATQIVWGLNYIENRYNTPCGAWSYWQIHSNY